MPILANFAEMAAFSSEGFALQEITETTSGGIKTTTIYAGKPPITDPSSSTNAVEGWSIRRTVVVDNGNGLTTVTTAWGRGSWNNRASLTNYKYL